MGLMQRVPYRAGLKYMQDLMSVDESRCVKCGLCAQLCPIDNIHMDEIPVFHGECTQCLRCYNFLSRGGYQIFKEITS